MPEAAALLGAITPWLTGQRWAAKDLSGAEAEVIATATAGDFTTYHLLVKTGAQVLNVPLIHGGSGPTPVGHYGGAPLFDAATDPRYLGAWLGVDANLVAPASGPNPFASVRDFTPLGGEQSNTSLLAGPAVVKTFRNLVAGPHPEVEVSLALWEQGFTHLPQPLAVHRVGSWVSGFATRLVAGARDGFQWATGAGADQTPDLIERIRDLGAVTARMHRALAAAFGTTTATLIPGERVRPQVDLVRPALTSALTGSEVAALDDLLATATTPLPGVAHRIHGDFHLGQTLLDTTERWLILDFEGEPLRPLAQRTAPDVVERDLAGMVRSFAYAGKIGGHDRGWLAAVRAAYLDGYGPYQPDALAWCELEKALYEVRYELAHRPDWVAIPLAGVRTALVVLRDLPS